MDIKDIENDLTSNLKVLEAETKDMNMYYVAGYHQAKAGLPMDGLTDGMQSDLKFLIHHARTNPNNITVISDMIDALERKFGLKA
jgi:hypothetical protein